MSGDLTQPFDNDPVNQDFKPITTLYTVPAGKFARVTAVMSGSAIGSTSFAALSSALTNSVNTNSDSSVATYWLTDGDTIEIEGTAATGSVGPVTNANVSGTTTVRTKINGNLVAEIEITGSANATESAAGASASVSGSFKGNLSVQEYNKVS